MKVIVTTPYSKALTRTGTVVGTCKRKQLTCTGIKLDKPTPDGAVFARVVAGGYTPFTGSI